MTILFETTGAELGATPNRQCRPLEIRILSHHAGRIKFGRPNAIRITARHSTAFLADVTSFHNLSKVMLT